jgi:hypothetical protein
MELKPAYITIVEGPPPEFQEVIHRWPGSVLESQTSDQVVIVEMRTFDGPKLVKRCQDAWASGRDARLNFPTEGGARGELDIVAIRWEQVAEGHKLFLWVRIDGVIEFDEDVFDDF